MPAKKKSPVKKKAVPVRTAPVNEQTPLTRSAAKITKSHADALMKHVNGLLADQGFSAQVTAMHFTPAEDDTLGCGNCGPNQACKRVCFRDPQTGQLICENRCV
jgi:hypothetical protein